MSILCHWSINRCGLIGRSSQNQQERYTEVVTTIFLLGHGGGQVVSVLPFSSDDPSSDPAEFYSSYFKKCLKKCKRGWQTCTDPLSTEVFCGIFDS